MCFEMQRCRGWVLVDVEMDFLSFFIQKYRFSRVHISLSFEVMPVVQRCHDPRNLGGPRAIVARRGSRGFCPDGFARQKFHPFAKI